MSFSHVVYFNLVWPSTHVSIGEMPDDFWLILILDVYRKSVEHCTEKHCGSSIYISYSIVIARTEVGNVCKV